MASAANNRDQASKMTEATGEIQPLQGEVRAFFRLMVCRFSTELYLPRAQRHVTARYASCIQSNFMETYAQRLTDEFRHSLLHKAAFNGNTEEIQARITAGDDVNGKDEFQQTPLHLASWNGHLKSIDILINSKANLNIKNEFEYTPLSIATFVEQNGAVETLLRFGANPNLTNELGSSPLIMASFLGNVEITKFLINGGANLNHTNLTKQTSLHMAAHSCCPKVIQILIHAGADANRIGNIDKTALIVAVHMSGKSDRNGRIRKHSIEKCAQCVRILANESVNLNHRDCLKNNALDWAKEQDVEEPIIDILKNASSIPFPTDKKLSNQCRLIVRDTLNKHHIIPQFSEKLKRLTLPAKLKEYLTGTLPPIGEATEHSPAASCFGTIAPD